ncbi:hypothetical protein SAMN02982929_06728 [Saccharopolyspora kobensis]|uniref:Uncharacterized protein n=1 Tax=Saccharopolyspora kobensis TaxID=146035 RepID=A0A1H6EJV8_9PSEU|nr:hypothetical protein [Saccharopolyspora kobensis]SEG97401.1 hypothetical protein SAMN02982929_06728 [Saccharopolyspora kobensis]SFC79889.1 hypothetical protein SAMN05216506_1011725 [Saccharopolyspora kobensis]
MNPETPETDAVEQARQVDELAEDEEPEQVEAPLDADPADLADQHRAVPLDDAYDHD